MMHSPDHQGELARLAGHHTHQQQQQQQQQQQHTQQQHQQQPLSMAAAPAGATVAAAASAAAAVAPASLPGRPAVTGAQAPAPAPYGVVAAADGAYLGPRAGCTACVAVARGGELFVANGALRVYAFSEGWGRGGPGGFGFPAGRESNARGVAGLAGACRPAP